MTLFASGDSVTQARLVAACPRALRLDEQCVDQLAHGMVLLDQVFRLAPTFALLHFISTTTFPVDTTALSTRDHAARPTGIPDLYRCSRRFHMPVVSISDAQRTPLPWPHWQGRCIMACRE